MLKIQLSSFMFEAGCTKMTKPMKSNCQNKQIQVQIRQRTNLQAPIISYTKYKVVS